MIKIAIKINPIHVSPKIIIKSIPIEKQIMEYPINFFIHMHLLFLFLSAYV